MAITRLNHAVLFVRDADVSSRFYEDVLGFRRVGPEDSSGRVFMQAPDSTNDHDLGLFSIGQADAGPATVRRTVGLYHLAWEVDTLAELERLHDVLADRGALVGSSDHGTTKSLYAMDPDGIEFEVAWIIPADQLDDAARAARSTIRPLDISREQRRYGSTTAGGIGVSR